MKKYSIIAGLFLALLFFGCTTQKTNNATGDAVLQANENSVKEFTIKAFRFGYEPNSLTVKEGDKVKITIQNTDTLHGIRIPDLNVRGNETVEFIAEKKGEYIWYCTNMCGEGHTSMQGKLIVG